MIVKDSSKDDLTLIMWFFKKEKRPTQNLNLYFSNYSSLNSQIAYLNFSIFAPLRTQLIVLCILWMVDLACRMADWPLQKSLQPEYKCEGKT